MENGDILVRLSPESAIDLYRVLRGVAAVLASGRESEICHEVMSDIKFKLAPEHARRLDA